MVLEEKKIPLRDGRTAVLRSPSVEDAEKLLRFIRKASGETEYLLRYPEEWDIPVEQETEWVERMRSAPSDMVITCYVDGTVVGNCQISCQTGIKASHRASIAIAVLRAYWGLGVGSAMMEALVDTARSWGKEILELEYIDGNHRARHLYEKFGFREISRRPNVFKCRDGSYQNVVYMQKYL